MPTFLSRGRLHAFRIDLSGNSPSDFEKCKNALEDVAEMVSTAPCQNLKVYWQFEEPIQQLVDLPVDCPILPWAD